MTSRGLVLIWCVAITLVTLIVIALATFTKDAQDNFDKIPAAPVVIIGSSLMRHAVPPLGYGDDSLLGDGRAHIRLEISSISEGQTVALLRRVLNSDVKTVMIEANALAFDFASSAPAYNQSSSWPMALMKPLMDLSTYTRQRVKRVSSLIEKRSTSISEAELETKFVVKPGYIASHEAELETKFYVKPNYIASHYPLHLRLPKHPEVLEAAQRMAAENGVDLILIAPPRSEFAANAMGAEATEMLRLHFQALAHHLNLPLFQPSAAWPNDHFIDAAHMNRSGRARFLNELAQWWANRS